MDYAKFVECRKSFLIAPAGFGKTHTIVECLKLTTDHQLILTHTHAGIASIKEKLRKSQIPSKSYTIETISGFVQRYCLAFCTCELPSQDDKTYHSVLVSKFSALIDRKLIRCVLIESYKGIFIDEYQDCTPEQHNMSMKLSALLPTHILGDPLQGIFDFAGAGIDFERDLIGFTKFADLTIAQRWNRNGSPELGAEISKIRTSLEQWKKIDLSQIKCNGFYFLESPETDKFKPSSDYNKWLTQVIKNSSAKSELESLLVICPTYEMLKDGVTRPMGSVHERENLRKIIDPSYQLSLLEAIDDKQFYSLAKKCDAMILKIRGANKPIKKLHGEIFSAIFQKTSLDSWVGDNCLVRKKDAEQSLLSDGLSKLMSKLVETPSIENLITLLNYLKLTLKLKPKRLGLYRTLLRCLKESNQNGISVEEAMKENRNVIRRVGRKVVGKSIGTTLLTKGLEFDTVFIIDAHLFQCPKNFYVAVSRCCKKLIVVSDKKIISPYK